MTVRRAALLALAAAALAGLFGFPRLWRMWRMERDWPGGFGPNVAGTFYPGDREDLAEALDELLAAEPAKPYPGRLVGLIAPHAGLRYSGKVAAAAFRLLDGRRYDAVYVLGPAHYAARGWAATLDAPYYRTPLGAARLSIDSLTAPREGSAPIPLDRKPFEKEHSLEMQLFWLQRTLTDFALAPVALRAVSQEDAAALAARIAANAASGRTLLVASTDLSHYHEEGEARRLDEQTLAYILRGDTQGLEKAVRSGEAELCGLGPVLTLLALARSLKEPVFTPLAYATSADAGGGKDRVVGYAAVALSDAALPEHAADDPFAPEVRDELLSVARGAIEQDLLKRPAPRPQGLSPIFSEKRSAFVSLYCGGALRGCIGRPRTDDTLFDTLVAVAPSAARDPRFEPVTPEELPRCRVEVHVLTPLERVKDFSRIRVGRDGLVVRRLFEAGLYLPEVPVQQGWDRERFIDETCRKARIPPQVGRKKGDFFRFQAAKVAEP